MKHITEEYGTGCNYIESTYDEYRMMSAFLAKLGVETRTIIVDYEKGILVCRWQARNGYKQWTEIGGKMSAEQIRKTVENDIKQGWWRI